MIGAGGQLDAVRECIRRVMQLDDTAAAAITEQTNAAEVAGWDSQRHIELILALEDRFALQFGDDQIVELVSVAAILKALGKYP